MTDKIEEKTKLNIYIEDPTVNYKYRKSYDDLMKEIKEVDGEPTPCMYLVKINWNDYGYETKYFVEYMVDDKSYEIGAIKIGNTEMKNKPSSIEEKLEKITDKNLIKKDSDLGDNFFSLAQEEEFYINLRKYCKEKHGVQFLKKIRELTTLNNDKLDEISNKKIYNKSLIRNKNNVFTAEFLKVINKARIESGKASYEYLLDIYGKIVEDNYEFLDIKFKYYKYLVENSSEINHENLEEVLMDIKNNNKTNSYIVYKTSEELNKKLEEPDKKKLDELKNELDKELKAIEEKLFLDENKIGEKSLGHYTSLKTLKYLVKPIMTDSNDCDEESCDEKNKSRLGSSLRLSHYRQMNDPLEGKVLKNYLFEEQLSSKQESHIFVSAATTESDSLPMWKQYADDATGVFLEYKEDYLRDIIKCDEIDIAKVYYLDSHGNIASEDPTESQGIEDPTESQGIDVIIENIKSALCKIKEKIKDNPKYNDGTSGINEFLDEEGFRSRLDKISVCFKKKDYRYENEYRIILHVEDSLKGIIMEEDEIVPKLYTYLENEPLQYSKVIVGPKCITRDYIDPYIYHCARMMNLDIKIENSKIEYR